MRNNLKLDWCSFEAAKYAVMRWHYSKVMPAGKLIKIGVWEHGKFVGCVLFGRGANNHIGNPYDLKQTQVCELVRVALYKHECNVSQIVSVALKFLKLKCPDLELVISYADPQQKHLGIIYQAGNWVYIGTSTPLKELLLNGQKIHARTAFSKFGTTKGIKKSEISYFKYTYLMPLNKKIRKQIEALAQPYPKKENVRLKHSGDVPSPPARKGQFDSDLNASGGLPDAP